MSLTSAEQCDCNIRELSCSESSFGGKRGERRKARELKKEERSDLPDMTISPLSNELLAGQSKREEK